MCKLRFLRERFADLGLCRIHLGMKIFKLCVDILQTFGHIGKRVVDTDQIAARVLAQRDTVGHLPFESENKILSETLHGQRHGKAPVTADLHRFQTLDLFAGFQNSGTGVVLIGKGIARAPSYRQIRPSGAGVPPASPYPFPDP